MGKTEAHRQKRLAKKHSKSKAKRSAIIARKQQLRSVAGMMQLASGGEILDCHRGYQGCAGEQNGMVPVVLRRRGPNGRVAMGLFLVDCWCLGVKDCSGQLSSPEESREKLDWLDDRLNLHRCTAGEGKSIVDAGVEYADSMGLRPHADFKNIYPIWGDMQAESVPDDVEFGMNGRPTYIVGPYDDPHRQQLILEALRRSVGEGHFDRISPLDQFQSGSELRGWNTIPIEMFGDSNVVDVR